MATDIDTPETLAYRVGRLEKGVETLEKDKADRDLVMMLADDFKSLKRVIIGATLTVSGSAMVATISLLLTHAKP